VEVATTRIRWRLNRRFRFSTWTQEITFYSRARNCLFSCEIKRKTPPRRTEKATHQSVTMRILRTLDHGMRKIKHPAFDRIFLMVVHEYVWSSHNQPPLHPARGAGLQQIQIPAPRCYGTVRYSHKANISFDEMIKSTSFNRDTVRNTQQTSWKIFSLGSFRMDYVCII